MKARFELRKGCLISDIQEKVELFETDQSKRNEFYLNQCKIATTKDYFTNEIRVVDDERDIEDIRKDGDRFLLKDFMELPSVGVSVSLRAGYNNYSLYINGKIMFDKLTEDEYCNLYVVGCVQQGNNVEDCDDPLSILKISKQALAKVRF